MDMGFESVDIIPNDQPQAEIFKLKMDHFEELFDWLSICDFVALGQTCKRMHRIVGYYFKKTYAATEFVDFGQIRPVRDDIIPNLSINFDVLSSFIKTFRLNVFPLSYRMRAYRFEFLTGIVLDGDLNIRGITHDDKKILGQLKSIKLDGVTINEKREFYDSFLQFCTKLRTLRIRTYVGPIIGIDNRWLQRKYPTLEHFELTASEGAPPIDELQTFFEQNTDIKTFGMHIENLLMNRNTFRIIQTKLNVLSVIFFYKSFNSSRDFLNELHERGLFKELHIYFFPIIDSFDQDAINQLSSFNGFTKLGIKYGIDDEIDFTPLIELKQLYIENTPSLSTVKNIAKNLVNLEFVHFAHAEFDKIRSFICHSPKITKIVLNPLEKNNENIINVETLNKERSKMVNAKKVTIYVDESVYLAVKCRTNQINSNLIELKRGSTYDALNHNFDYWMSEYGLTF